MAANESVSFSLPSISEDGAAAGDFAYGPVAIGTTAKGALI